MKKILVGSALAVLVAAAFWIDRSSLKNPIAPAPHILRNVNDLSLIEVEEEISKIKRVIEKEKLVDLMNDPHADENRKNDAKKVIRYRLDLAMRKIDLHLGFLETQFSKGK